MRSKILVVDDDPDLLNLVCLSLKEAGFSVGMATNGLDALKKARSELPDLIVMDLILPEMDGFTVCEKLRGNPATASVPIIILTGMTGQMGRFNGLESGANDYVIKPFELNQLVSKVEQLLSRPRAASGAPGKPGRRCAGTRPAKSPPQAPQLAGQSH